MRNKAGCPIHLMELILYPIHHHHIPSTPLSHPLILNKANRTKAVNAKQEREMKLRVGEHSGMGEK